MSAPTLVVNNEIENSQIKKIKETDKLLNITYINRDKQQHNIILYYPPNIIAPDWSNQKGKTTYFSIAYDKVDTLYFKIMSYVNVKNNSTILELPCGVGEFAMNFYIKNRNTNINYIGLDLSKMFTQLNNINYKANNMKFLQHDCVKTPTISYKADYLICLGIYNIMHKFIETYAHQHKPKYIFVESNWWRHKIGDVTPKKLIDLGYKMVEKYTYKTKNTVKTRNNYIPVQDSCDRVLLIYKLK